VAANAEGAAPKRARRLHRILVRDGSGADPDGDSKKIERRVPQEEDVSHPEHEIETAIFAPDGISSERRRNREDVRLLAGLFLRRTAESNA
jgi:hypothetical protein